jgi:hypothetical protein
MTPIELQGKHLNNARLEVDGKVVLPVKVDSNLVCWNAPLGLVNIYYEPFKIDLLLRINGFLVNFWLGNISVQDHCLTFDLTEQFYDQYQQKDFEGRISSLGPNPSPLSIDRVIGRNFHQDLVNNIKNNLDKKSHTG